MTVLALLCMELVVICSHHLVWRSYVPWWSVWWGNVFKHYPPETCSCPDHQAVSSYTSSSASRILCSSNMLHILKLQKDTATKQLWKDTATKQSQTPETSFVCRQDAGVRVLAIMQPWSGKTFICHVLSFWLIGSFTCMVPVIYVTSQLNRFFLIF